MSQTPARPFVTAADVARRAKVSRSAVSRAFTPGASVSTAVRERVLRVADQLGYRVNGLARGLNHARTNLVGVVGTDLHQPFHAAFLASLSGALLADGFQCMLQNAGNASRDMAALISRVLEYRVRAIVVMAGTPPARIVEECVANGVRVILVNKDLPGLAIDTVMADHALGGREAARHLLAAGCTRLGVVASAARTASVLGRLAAFRAAATRAGASVRVWQEGPTTDYDSGHAAAVSMLRDDDLDGVFCVTDLLALGFMDGARYAARRRVPADVSVIGFDDIPQAAWGAYGLTTFRQPVDALRDAVMAKLAAMVADPELPPSLATRARPPRRARNGPARRGRPGARMKSTQVIAHRGSSARHATTAGRRSRRRWPNAPTPSNAMFRQAATASCSCDTISSSARIGWRISTGPRSSGARRASSSLPDLLAWARVAPIALLVESKAPAATTAIGRAIVDSGLVHRCVVGGFHGPALAAARRAVPELRTSFMIGSVAAVEELVPLCRAYGVEGVHLCWEARAPRPHELLLPDMVDRLRDAGLVVTLWHEERPDELHALVALRPDAICTNTPAVLRRIVDGADGLSGDGRGLPARGAHDAAATRPAVLAPRPGRADRRGMLAPH